MSKSSSTNQAWEIEANLVDLFQRRIFPARVKIEAGRIAAIKETTNAPDTWLIPGFVDAHVHIESSMLAPTEFARAAVVHGTVATVSDPHEIANVLGIDGVNYMLANGEESPFKFYFGAPSCVPATNFESAGAVLDVDAVAQLLDDDRIVYLSEMMNYPGVLFNDPTVMAKIKAAQDRGKPIDGHAPGLRGDEAKRYQAAGISTDHECFTIEEARDKLQLGMKILIREGSAARNFDALWPLLNESPEMCMLCSDDKHPDELLEGHINLLVKRALALGVDLFDALTAACRNPVEHYGLDVGLLRVGDAADFVEVDSLQDLRVVRTFIDGQSVAEHGNPLFESTRPTSINQFRKQNIARVDIQVPATGNRVNVIQANDGQLVTDRVVCTLPVENGLALANPADDILKLVVVNRYQAAPPAVAFIRGFGLNAGAIASSVAHDSHNVIAVGVDDAAICKAIHHVMESEGGLAVVTPDEEAVLPLPIAGLMSPNSCWQVAYDYEELDRLAKELGSPLRAPFMTLSFMALLVIPELKLSDLGLFDGKTFDFAPLFTDE